MSYQAGAPLYCAAVLALLGGTPSGLAHRFTFDGELRCQPGTDPFCAATATGIFHVLARP